MHFDSRIDILQTQLQVLFVPASAEFIHKRLRPCAKTVHAKIDQQKFGLGNNDPFQQPDIAVGGGSACCTRNSSAFGINKSFGDKLIDDRYNFFLIQQLLFLQDIFDGLRFPKRMRTLLRRILTL